MDENRVPHKFDASTLKVYIIYYILYIIYYILYIIYNIIYIYIMYINTTKNDQKGRPKSTKADMESSKTSSSWMVAMVALSACHSSPARGKKTADATLTWGMVHHPTHMAMCQNLVPLVNIKIAGKWMFIPLKMVLIGIDPYPYPLKILKGILGRVYGYGFPHLNLESRKIATCPYYLSSKNAEITDWPIPVTFTGPI